ncbi:efflux RND transporter permease subunit [Candidatus Fermentibacteria bacterium]|nr:efflux RND transporter permease subunit [Candidatus Fermentibacteria bacterium]
MRITQTAIKRGVTFLMIYIVAVGFGLFSLGRLRVDLWPRLDFPMIAVITQYTGVGPFDMETVVTRPLEEAVASVQNVKTVSSTSRQGLSLLMLEFGWGTDMNQAEIDVRNALEWVEDYLPPDVTDPLVFAFDPAMQPIGFYTVGSEVHGLAELRRISELELEPRIERIPGVASASTTGGLQREIKVLLDPVRLRARSTSAQQVELALQMNNRQVPSGWIDDEHQEFTIQTQGEYQSLEQIEQTAVASMEGSVVRIKDVADVVDGFVESRQQVWTNGKPAVILILQRQSDANTVSVTRELKKRLPGIMAELPKGVAVEAVYEQAEFINRSISNLGTTAIQAVLLTIVVLLVFLRNIRSSMIVALSIPISIIVTFAVMDQAGLTLNMISMAGLALAVGLLVDNSIVVLESIYRHRERGAEAWKAAEVGTNEVAMAITASTLTTASVFVPVLFVPGIAGEMFNDMVVTICFSLAASLAVALTLVPLLASRMLRIKDGTTPRSGFDRLGDRIGAGIDKARARYLVALRWSLFHRRVVLISAAGLFVLSVILLTTRGGEFLPHSDMGFVQVAFDRSAGTSLAATETSVRTLHEIVNNAVPEAEMVYTNFGQGEGVFAAFSASGSNQGEMMIRLKPRSHRARSMQRIQDDLRERVNAIPDLNVRFEDRGAEAFFGGAGDIAVEIFGHDLEVAEALARDIVATVEGIRGVATTEVSVEDAAHELKIRLDRQRIADLGLSTAQVGQVISTSVLGSVATRYREGGDEFDVRVQLREDARRNHVDIGNILLMTPGGRQVPLRAVADLSFGTAPAAITREDQERKVTVAIDVSGRDLRRTTTDVQRALAQIAVPNDFRVEIGGSAKEMMESFMFLGIAFIVAMALTYMVMASQFESLVDPFIILFTIPLSIIGVALGLTLTGTTLSVMSLIGIIMLIGIIVNNGIVLVDYTNQLREQGHPLFEAIMLAGEARMRPVIMTALTTMLAMLPLALGLGESGENWAPMARSLIGGLLVGTALTLVVVPVIYAALETGAQKRRERRQTGRVSSSAEQPA